MTASMQHISATILLLVTAPFVTAMSWSVLPSHEGSSLSAGTQSLSDFGTTNNALLPSAAEVATASAEAIAAAAPPAAAPTASPAPNLASGINNAANSNAGAPHLYVNVY
jgi:hypothetical protein